MQTHSHTYAHIYIHMAKLGVLYSLLAILKVCKEEGKIERLSRSTSVTGAVTSTLPKLVLKTFLKVHVFLKCVEIVKIADREKGSEGERRCLTSKKAEPSIKARSLAVSLGSLK